MKAQLASLLLRMLASTWRVRVVGTLPDAPCVVAFWHGAMLPVWHAFRLRGCAGLTSASKDGDLLARLLADWGYVVVRGSSSKGGPEALAEMVKHASRRIVLVTPDGPRGPARVAKPGAVVAAQRAGVPLVPVGAAAERVTILEKSWDAFAIPWPFTRVTVQIGAPIRIDADASRERVDAVISELGQQLDALRGVA